MIGNDALAKGRPRPLLWTHSSRSVAIEPLSFGYGTEPLSFGYGTGIPIAVEAREAVVCDHALMRQLLDVEFEFAGDDLGAVRKAGERIVVDSPHLRFDNRRGVKLNPYGFGPFSRLIAPRLPDAPGAYAVTSGAGDVLYVGRARDLLMARWGRRGYSVIDPRNCYVGGQSTNCHINGLVTAGLVAGQRFALWYHLIDQPDDLERRLLGVLRPPWNVR